MKEGSNLFLPDYTYLGDEATQVYYLESHTYPGDEDTQK